MNRRNREYIELLKDSFNENKYIGFVKDLLNMSSEELNTHYEEIRPTQKQYSEDIKFYKYFAKYNDGINNIGSFIVNIRSTNERNKQRNFIATLLSQYSLDAALVAFITDNDTSWRISFVRKELSFTDKGVKQELTPARRYSYLVGPNESVHTAQEYLLRLLDIDNMKIKIEDIESVFDVEKVTKKFFEQYKEQFLKLHDYLEKNEDFKTESIKYDFDSVEFAKRLMGQIVFLYFLQKKGWLGVQLIPDMIPSEEFNVLINTNDSICQKLLNTFFIKKGDNYQIDRNKISEAHIEDIRLFTSIFKNSKYDNLWGSGDKTFIRTIYKYAQTTHKNFFDEILEPFFYEGLNTPRKEINNYFQLFNCKVPFLNGGLFEPLNNYDWHSSVFNIPNKFFSNENNDGILDFLDLYNFTIDEEEPLEKEVAVDPEMLGKIFENLLEVNDRKSKGAFYTPREIVYYMCQESLANYLVNKLEIDYNEIIEFIKYGDYICQLDIERADLDNSEFQIGKSILDNLFEIDDALSAIRIADPAVGSGAFPLGMLTEIVKVRDAISTYIILQHERGIIDDEKFNAFNYKDIYSLKKETIENCIYAVDIELSAIDIAKLRLWLSLIVDYPDYKEPKPLPNLDFKILQGNSLVDEYEGIALFNSSLLNNNLKNYHRNTEIKEIKSISIQFGLFDQNINIDQQMEQLSKYQQQYFITSDVKYKNELKSKIEDIQNSMIKFRLSPNQISKFEADCKKRKKDWLIWELDFYDVFKNNGGFDIVIGNPPYVDYRKIDNITKKYLSKNSLCYKKVKTASLYVYFIERGLNLINKNGLLIYINPYQYLSADNGIGIREYLFDNNVAINKLVDVSNIRVFSSAQTYTCINMFSNKNSKKILYYSPSDILELETNKKELDYIKYKSDKLHKIIINSNTIIEKLDGINEKFSNYAKIFCGLSMPGMGKKTINKELIPYGKEHLYVPFVTTKDFDRNHISINKYIEKKYYSASVQKIFETGDHVFIGRMTKIIRANIFHPGVYCGKVNCVYNNSISNEYILSILNSNLINYYYLIKNESKHQDGGYFGMDIPSLENIPFVYNEKYTPILKKLYFETNYKEINKIVYEIYNISQSEINEIEQFLLKTVDNAE